MFIWIPPSSPGAHAASTLGWNIAAWHWKWPFPSVGLGSWVQHRYGYPGNSTASANRSNRQIRQVNQYNEFQNLIIGLRMWYYRWAVTIKPNILGFRSSKHRVFMYNYLSIGVDAQVTLNFHRTRESPFYLFSHRIFNKVYLVIDSSNHRKNHRIPPFIFLHFSYCIWVLVLIKWSIQSVVILRSASRFT